MRCPPEGRTGMEWVYLLQTLSLVPGAGTHTCSDPAITGRQPSARPGVHKQPNLAYHPFLQNTVLLKHSHTHLNVFRGFFHAATVRACQVAQGVQLFATPWTAARQAPLSMGFSRQEYWGGVPFSPPANFPDPGIKPASLMAPALADGLFITSAIWEANCKRDPLRPLLEKFPDPCCNG